MPSIAVIGHGRSPEGRGWGSKIDRCSTVLRMWDWTWQDAEDYGRKYSIGLFEAHPMMMPKFNQNRKAEPSVGWIASVLHLVDMDLPDGTELVDQSPWNEVGRRLGGLGATGKLQFTRGTIAACWAIEQGCWNRVVLVGFDNVVSGVSLPLEEAFSPEYRCNPGTLTFDYYQPNVSKYGNHDFAIELPVMNYLAGERGVSLVLAQDVWK